MNQYSRLTSFPSAVSPRRTAATAVLTRSAVRRVALLGNHLPRHCGIATFTTHLGDAISGAFPEIDCFVLAMNDRGARYPYPQNVRFEIDESDVSSYRRAAHFLNVNTVDVLCVQHEYGIFGGKAGSHVLGMLREMRMPIVTTLHTILSAPNPAQHASLTEIAQLSERLVVMSAHGADLLHASRVGGRDGRESITALGALRPSRLKMSSSALRVATSSISVSLSATTFSRTTSSTVPQSPPPLHGNGHAGALVDDVLAEAAQARHRADELHFRQRLLDGILGHAQRAGDGQVAHVVLHQRVEQLCHHAAQAFAVTAGRGTLPRVRNGTTRTRPAAVRRSSCSSSSFSPVPPFVCVGRPLSLRPFGAGMHHQREHPPELDQAGAARFGILIRRSRCTHHEDEDGPSCPTFKTTVLQAHDMDATGIEVPEAVVEKLGSGKRPRLRYLNGYTYRSTVAVMGGQFMLPLAASTAPRPEWRVATRSP